MSNSKQKKTQEIAQYVCDNICNDEKIMQDFREKFKIEIKKHIAKRFNIPEADLEIKAPDFL